MAWTDAVELGLNCGVDKTFCPVAYHGFTQAASRGDSDMDALCLVFIYNQHDKRVSKRLS